MAGDLIVGGVRPGIVNKWQSLRQRALEDLQASGLTLIVDEEPSIESSPRASARDRLVASPDDARSPFDMPREDAPLGPMPLGDLPSLEELAPLDDLGSALDGAAARDDASQDDSVEPLEGALAAEDPEAETVAATLDRFCGLLADIERLPQSDHGARFAQTDQALAYLLTDAASHQCKGSIVLAETMRRLVQAACDLPVAPEDKFYELAYAFSGLYAEEAMDPFAPSVHNWSIECESLLRSWSAFKVTKERDAGSTPPEAEASLFDMAEAADTPSEMETPIFDLDADIEAESPQQPDFLAGETEAPMTMEPIGSVAGAAAAPSQAQPLTPGTPEHFLWIAQRAFAEGKTMNAKALALQAVSSIAKAEADQAEKALQETEKRLQAEAEAIKQSMAEAQGAEDAVTKAEQRITESRETHTRQQEATTQTQKQVGEIQVRLGAIEEQLRELQEKRDEVAGMLDRARQELVLARQSEKDREEEVTRLRAEEESARRLLESMRQTVKSHQRRRSEIESEMEKSRDDLKSKRESFTNLQETIAHLGVSAPDPNTDPEDWLF